MRLALDAACEREARLLVPEKEVYDRSRYRGADLDVHVGRGRADERKRDVYCIDFALITLAGNLTRYRTLRPLVEQDLSVTSRWFPIRTWVQDDWLRVLPSGMRVRIRHLLDSWRLFIASPPDAIVIHAFETYYLYALMHWLLRRRTVIVKAPDGPLPTGRLGQGWLQRLAIGRTTMFVPFSHWAGEKIREGNPQIPPECIVPIHPGIDLSLWPTRPAAMSGDRLRILFVAGNLVLKGVDVLLDAFECALSQTCELHIATQSAYLPNATRERINQLPNATLHLDLEPNGEELRGLYGQCDAFVSPTKADTSSWVALEALATGIPVVITALGGIPEIVVDGETGLLIPPNDPRALADAVERLRLSPELRDKLAEQGRRRVEEHFDARKNTDKLLALVKRLVDTAEAQRRH